MKRVKRHKIKQEMPETSTSRSREQEEHDLAYYIHDRVELMHQVFSVIKPKELKAMAPECVHDISVVDLQELCTEELLGISSKRLCAILDGADPPTDTESSSSDHNLETISLDSISSDDEVLSQHSSKKKHKHKKHSKKNKHKRKGSKDSKADESREEEDRSKASRAGLTVLELLELQARARAIRAQLQQDHASAPTERQQTETKTKDETSEDEVEIKEEPAEVVEISSEDEKPKLEDLLPNASANNKEGQAQSNSNTVTKRINDLIVTVPQTTQSRKIVLNRKNKNLATSSSETSTTKDKSKNDSPKSKPSTADPGKADSSTTTAEKSTNSITHDKTKVSGETSNSTAKAVTNKSNKKKKQKKKDNKSDKEEDHDEITLQLSDTEKMDLLEDLDRKNYDNFTSSSEDSESSSESESEHDTSQDSTVVSGMNEKDNVSPRNSSDSDKNIINGQENSEPVNSKVNNVNNDIEKNNCRESDKNINNFKNDTTDVVKDSNRRENVDETSENEKVIHISEKEKLSTDSDNFDMNSKENTEVIAVSSNKRSEMKSDGVKDTSPSTDPTEDSSRINTVHISQNNPIIEIDANKSPDIVRERTKSPQNSIHKTVGGDFNTNKNLDIEVETNKSVEEVNTASEKPKEKITVIESIIIQVKNDNFTETEQKETDKSLRSVVARVENERTQSHDLCTENIHKASEKATERFTTSANDSIESIEEGEITNTNKDLSEGEITDNEEETQTNNSKPNQADVVCVSDEDSDKRKKKKKKGKKTKKEKKSKKSKSDFREGADQNFYREADTIVIREDVDHQDNPNNTTIDEGHSNNKGNDDIVSLDDDDDIYEILEISDDSSCYEVEGITVSKEPTAAEIAALSAKIDEINTDDVIVINEEDNEENAETLGSNENISEEIESISWRDRYLGSNKVKRVLTTSNILNALRKKNKELKRKLEESKKKIEEVTEGEKQVLEKISDFVEGSIEHFNTLQGSTKYVDPVVPEVQKEVENKEGTQTEDGKSIEGQGSEGGLKEVTKEMEKDAKQLLKMYKRLLKYNDMNKKKEKDRNKKKKKKHKKNKDIVISEK